ncbi:MAG: ATP-binding protein [Saprospiraceae bacterium]|nr:ATP-binding protein [Saprospiraceae bacterium]MBK7437019.1 ATP-binding protein [Saprospiraceae bacterium]MBK8283022.1 ATP-binding protein [Saprospiraceae bacterium]MBK8512947.1 ATP-binding protein [Saprospiraceae bacterium]MBK8775922.1 ATP-binding protein [Saprospiraceae bacterium]
MLITIINNIQEISLVHETLLTYMAKLPLDSEDQKKISIAVDEILSNIIFYGFEDHLEHHITLQLKHSEGNIDLEFVDDGIHFDPLEFIHMRQSLPKTDKAGGLGLDIVAKLMHQLHYRRIENKNILTLNMKYRAI